MSLTAHSSHPSSARAVEDEVRRLRAQVDRAQVRRLDAPPLPSHPALGELLPDGGLRPGSVYSVTSSTSLLFSLLAPPSQAGTWCGVIGMPEFGVEAAESAGIDLARLVLVPAPGARWLTVAATVAEVLPVIAVRPMGGVGAADAARLGARLRDRGAVLLVMGAWAGADAVLSTSEPKWSGLGSGHGYLTQREITVTVTSKRSPSPRRGRMLLPGPSGIPLARVEALHHDDTSTVVPMRAVG